MKFLNSTQTDKNSGAALRPFVLYYSDIIYFCAISPEIFHSWPQKQSAIDLMRILGTIRSKFPFVLPIDFVEFYEIRFHLSILRRDALG